jgi:GNAT superfamily N-acetyltransferase
MRWNRDGYEISDERAALDLEAVCRLLADTYWAAGRSAERIARTVENSIVFGLFHQGRQVGLARVLSDFAGTSYVCDVVVDPGHRGRGVGRWLMECVLEHPAVRETTVLLVTRDAQEFYAKLGFVRHPYDCMKRDRPAP